MKGYEIKNITYANSSKKLCTSKVSLKLDIAKTFAAHGSIYTAEEEASALLSDLYYAGYNIVEP